MGFVTGHGFYNVAYILICKERLVIKPMDHISGRSVNRSIKEVFWLLFGIDQQRFSTREQRLFYRTLRTRITYALIGALVVCAIATYAALAGLTPLLEDPGVTILLLNLDMVILLLLTVFLVRRVISLWSGRKRGIAGSHLQVWLVYAFSFLAATPAIVMALFSAFFFHYGVQAWFNDRVQSAVESSAAVAVAYLEEHKQGIAGDARLMASEIDRLGVSFQHDAEMMEQLLFRQALIFDLSEAMIFDERGRVHARSGLTFSLEYTEIPPFAMRTAKSGEIVILTGANENRVRALVKLNNYNGRFLYVGRMIDPDVLGYLNETRKASADYSNLRARYGDLQVIVVMIFVVVGMVLVLTAVWLGLVLSRRLVLPISKLVNATDQVRSGDFTARMPEDSRLEEFDHLAQAFNRMTEHIEAQRAELLLTNRQLDERRRLTETVLRGVMSGVLGLDRRGEIKLANISARKLLVADEKADIVGAKLKKILPEALPLLELAYEQPQKIHEDEITLERAEDGRRTYFLRIALEAHDEDDMRAILTFDDVTDLQKAQKAAAWSDVARRIAHEIKNPLTPIQLSAERLARKYAGQVEADGRDVFEQCIDTIIRHVGDIGRMVDEFSAFARMPEPRLEQGNPVRLAEESLFLQREAHGGIKYELIDALDDKQTVAIFDPQQLRQVLTNLLQNAADSIEDSAVKKGRIRVTVLDHDSMVAIVVNDNGPGFPAGDHPQHLLEPYVTHKPKGTGLGLAIVKKIVDDHEGRLVLGVPSWLKQMSRWSDLGGATVVVMLPVSGCSLENSTDGAE